MSNILRQFWCWLVGHHRDYYKRDGIIYSRCKCCKTDLKLEFDNSDLFGW